MLTDCGEGNIELACRRWHRERRKADFLDTEGAGASSRKPRLSKARIWPTGTCLKPRAFVGCEGGAVF